MIVDRGGKKLKTKEKGDSWWIWIVVGVVGWSVVSRELSRSQNERVALERRKEGKGVTILLR